MLFGIFQLVERFKIADLAESKIRRVCQPHGKIYNHGYGTRLGHAIQSHDVR